MRMTEQERRIRIRHLKRMHRIRERKERHDKKVSGLFMKRVVFTLILAAFIFTVVMIFVFLRMGSEPSTLIENVFRFLSVEGGAMALIKSVKTVKGTKSNGEIQHDNHTSEHDITKRHFDDCKSKTGVLDKPERSRNMIAAPKGYDSKEKDLGV